MIFDPIKTRQVSEEGTVRRISTTEFDKDRPMGNVAMMQLDQVIKIYLVGLAADIRDILPRSIDWIESAISKGEEFGVSHDFHLMNLHRAAAIYKWLISGCEEVYHWDRSRILNDKISVDEKVYNKRELSTSRLNEYLSFCYFSRKYKFGVDEFDKFFELLNINKGILSPCEFSYVACMHELYGIFDRFDIFKAGRKMLKKNLQENWIGSGQCVEAVIYLKMVYQYQEFELSPLDIILKAYDDMPNVIRPEFI